MGSGVSAARAEAIGARTKQTAPSAAAAPATAFLIVLSYFNESALGEQRFLGRHVRELALMGAHVLLPVNKRAFVPEVRTAGRARLVVGLDLDELAVLDLDDQVRGVDVMRRRHRRHQEAIRRIWAHRVELVEQAGPRERV